MSTIPSTIAEIESKGDNFVREIRATGAKQVKPLGSLGLLEEIALQLGSIRRTRAPRVAKKAIVLLAGDHGIVEEGVSAYPPSVTRQMFHTFATGGAAVNVLAERYGTDLVLVDMGMLEAASVASPRPGVRVVNARCGAGTENFAKRPAMTREDAVAAVERGIAVATSLAAEGYDALGLGEMGIGNSTVASALASVLSDREVATFVGQGASADASGIAHKQRVLERALMARAPSPRDPIDVLSKVGGYEVAGLVGVILGGARRRLPIVLDGLVTSVAALAAVSLCPQANDYIFASHKAAEPGHDIVLAALGKSAALDLNLRVGEGAGAVLGLNLLGAAAHLLTDVAQITDTPRYAVA